MDAGFSEEGHGVQWGGDLHVPRPRCPPGSWKAPSPVSSPRGSGPQAGTGTGDPAPLPPGDCLGVPRRCPPHPPPPTPLLPPLPGSRRLSGRAAPCLPSSGRYGRAWGSSHTPVREKTGLSHVQGLTDGAAARLCRESRPAGPATGRHARHLAVAPPTPTPHPPCCSRARNPALMMLHCFTDQEQVCGARAGCPHVRTGGGPFQLFPEVQLAVHHHAVPRGEVAGPLGQVSPRQATHRACRDKPDRGLPGPHGEGVGPRACLGGPRGQGRSAHLMRGRA